MAVTLFVSGYGLYTRPPLRQATTRRPLSLGNAEAHDGSSLCRIAMIVLDGDTWAVAQSMRHLNPHGAHFRALQRQ